MENINKALGLRIKSEREAQGIQQNELAKMVGVVPSTIQRYESGTFKAPKLPVIESIAKSLNVNPMWLLGKESDKKAVEISTNIEYDSYNNIMPIQTQRIPLLGEIACGEPIYASEDRESYAEVGTQIKADFCLRAKGDSMINARIQDGDIVFIRKQPMVENGEIAAVIIDNEATLKRVYYYPDNGKLVLQAENPLYEPFVYVGEELNTIKILGKAIAFQSDVK